MQATNPLQSNPDSEFIRDLERVINAHSKENGSNTPDFILAEFLAKILSAFDELMQQRAKWYGRMDEPGQQPSAPPQ